MKGLDLGDALVDDGMSLVTNQALLQAVLEHVNDGVVACDSDGVLRVMNRAARIFHGLPLERLSSETWPTTYSLYAPGTNRLLRPDEVPLLKALRGQQIHNVPISIKPEGLRRREVICSGRQVLDSAGRVVGAVVSMRDMTDLLEARDELEQFAATDRLTGLPSREHIYAALQGRVDTHGVDDDFAFLLLDIDHFSDINDVYGHIHGDTLLRQLAGRMRKIVDGDAIVARLGGDEFAVLYPGAVDAEAKKALACAVMTAFDAPFEIEGVGRILVHASVGVSGCCSDLGVPLSAAEILSRADVALTEAKRRGRSQWVLHLDEMSQALQARTKVGNDIADALASGSPEDFGFSLVYQPQLDASTGLLVGVEALARWHHPELGHIPPSFFVRIAEETGNAASFGAWVLNVACTAMARWCREGDAPDTIAVNVSALELRGAGFEERVRATLQRTGLDPRRLELEITESFSAAEWNDLAGTLRNLSDLGVNWSLDDFGTGYSSLLQLRKLPFGRLKIAQEFVRDMLEDASDAAIVRATIDLARALGMQVVAEGVETREQLRLLRAWQCDLLQGYLFDRPLPESEIRQKIARSHELHWANVETIRNLASVD